jgi:deoxyribonuclease V
LYISLKEAAKIQKELASQVIIKDIPDEINYVAGIDVSQLLYSAGKEDIPFFAAAVIFSFPDLKITEKVHHSEHVDFPYIPGFLAFREVPVILKALEKIKTKPDIILVDGHGISHPRKLGIASHIGVLTGYRTIGCAKSILIGKPETPLPYEKGSYVPLIRKGEIVGNELRTKNNVKPVYVSVGHKITLEKATEIVLACTTKYRIPEPLRAAHEYANYVRKSNILE